jgi:hypothetical protein
MTTKGDNNDEGTTHHPPPASQATARGVGSRWNDDNDIDKRGTTTPTKGGRTTPTKGGQ